MGLLAFARLYMGHESKTRKGRLYFTKVSAGKQGQVRWRDL